MQLPQSYTLTVPTDSIDLSVSVNPLGCSPRVVRRLRKLTAANLSRYPDTKQLEKQIAARFGILPELVLLGSGSEQLIKLVAQTFLEPGDVVAVQKGSFFLFAKEALLARSRVRWWGVNGTRRVQKAKLLFLANPATPTGEALTNRQIRAVIGRISPEITVIDEANGEFWRESFIGQPSAVSSLLVLRTFSKAFGLAGMRVAFMTGSAQLLARLREAQQPFPVSSMAILAVSEALRDEQFIKQTVAFVAAERAFLADELRARGFLVSNSVTNNLFIQVASEVAAVTALQEVGVAVVAGSFFPKNPLKGFRISIRDTETNRLFLDRLDEARRGAPAAFYG